ncbi:DUF2933 domain-containing protein [Streptosporangium pseudovulgare]|uniref:DUF2933 domain-containing protein n=1 Tax=Streptosporangium pseudovulgare TaxID=35765 RepID=A0ABQ2RL62_9ACTN|nr:DUF2933 domain-containing protein [Streptosporangium pseudovulgare]GGQ32181.1 hypothetical protein GCM10010140_72850 [Streptosporangium pseudovulgare]
MNIVKNTTRAYGLYALVFVAAWVGALALGMPGHILILLAIVAACPLVMLLMMGSMRGDRGDGRTGLISAGSGNRRPGPHGSTSWVPWPSWRR